MFQVPGGVIMVVAATRMHRSLVDFAYTPSAAMGEGIQTIGLKFAKTKQSSTTPISHNLIEIPVHTTLESHLTLQIDNHDSSINTDEDASGSSLDKDIERGE